VGDYYLTKRFEWYNDTCDCSFVLTSSYQHIESLSHCRLHKKLSGQLHLVTVMEQQRRFNYAIMDKDPNDTDLERIESAKIINKERIRKEADLKNFHEHLPTHHTEISLSFLRRLLRI